MSRYCFACGHTTAGPALFCEACGRSYGVRLCPGKHVNPRHAEVCSRCGSRDLSTPQPIVPIAVRLLTFSARAVAMLCLVALALAIVIAVLSSEQGQGAIIALGMVGIALWWLWKQLPKGLQELFRRAFKRKRGARHEE